MTNKKWIRKVWAEFERAKLQKSPVHHHETWRQRLGHWWLCIRVVVALRLDREVVQESDEDDLVTDVGLAWEDLGRYSTDFGDGYAFAELRLHKWLRFSIVEDGSL